LCYANEGGDAHLVLRALNELDHHFVIDKFEVGQKALVGFAELASTNEAFASLNEPANKFIDEAIMADRVEVAKNMTESVYEALVKKPVAAEYRKQALDLRNRIQEFSAQWQAVQSAIAKLAASSDDPEANETVGRWTCFVKRDWKKGLPLLAKAASPSLRMVAQRELSGEPRSSQDEHAIADGWWEIAQSEDGLTKKNLQQRAASWYLRARCSVESPLQTIKLDQRLMEIRSLCPKPLPELGIPDDMALLFTFDSNSRYGKENVRLRDFSGQGNDGTINGATNKTGFVGDALFFDGRDDHVDVAHSPSLLLAGRFTVSSWVNVSSRQGKLNDIISNDDFKTRSRGFVVRTGSPWDGKLNFATGDGTPVGVGTGWPEFTSKKPLDLGVWYHVAVILDKDERRVYLDGSLDNSAPWERNFAPSDFSLRVGGPTFFKDGRWFHGSVDELAIYSRALSDEEIKAIYITGLAGHSLAVAKSGNTSQD